MTTADVRAHEESLVRELWGQGLSIRAIAKRTGFSRPKVDRILARIARPFGADVDDDLDDTEDLLALMAAEPVNEEELEGPFVYVGTDEGGHRFVDAHGRPCNLLHIYRAAHHRGEGYKDDDGNRVYTPLTAEMIA